MGRNRVTVEAMVRPLRDVQAEEALVKLYDLRSQLPHEKYGELANAFKHVAKKRQEGLTRKLRSFSEVYWLPAAPKMSFEAEFAWARVYLLPVAKSLSAHAARLQFMQASLERGDFEGILQSAEESVSANGWSFWAASLMIAATFAEGSSKAGPVSAELQRAGAGRISGLLAKMASDRNDPSIPYGSFEARCKEFFTRLDDPSRVALYKARALSMLDDPDQCLHLLAFDAPSSYVDYYESLIHVSCLVLEQNDSEADGRVIKECLVALIGAGVKDPRLESIVGLHGRIPLAEDRVLDPPLLDIVSRCTSLGTPEPPTSSPWVSKVHKRISLTDSMGLAAADEVDELIRAGVNFSALPSGRAIWQKAMQPFMPIEKLSLFFGGLPSGGGRHPLFDLLARSDEEVVAAVRGAADGPARETINAIDEGFPISIGVIPSALDVWLARYLIRNDRAEQGRSLAGELKAHGGVWRRYGAKLEILASAAVGDLQEALKGCAEQIAVDSRLAYELPIESVLGGKSWRQLSGLPSWLVAMVTHYANNVSPSSRNRFVCRMACRELFKQMDRVGVDRFLEDHSEGDRALLCNFLRVGWTDENLSMVEDLASSQDLRRERLKVFQVLLAMDDSNAEAYRRMIQALTLDETLWAGLREIDSNRIFVNEPAITRWAEKELAPEYERWKAVRVSEGPADVKLDQILRAYLLNHDVNTLLSALPVGQQSEASALMLNIVTRLFARFLLDPANGLNSYLSLRVRHGTLRGVLLGPIEEDRLLLSGEYSEEEFEKRWKGSVALSSQQRVELRRSLASFGEALDSLAKWIVNEKVQIWSASKPEGMFASRLDPTNAQLLFGAVDPSMSFSFFLNQCYLVFWDALGPSRTAVSDFFLSAVSEKVQLEFQSVMGRLSDEFGVEAIRPLYVALQGLATRSAESCRVIAEWFLPVAPGHEQTYPVRAALEIARKATANVYRDFHSELRVEGDAAADIGLSTTGLSIVYDSLFVVFGNAWVHSGMGAELGPLAIKFKYLDEQQVLNLRVENGLSDHRKRELTSGQLDQLREKYMSEVPLELVPIEGGSGFAKLARIAAAVDRRELHEPLNFGISTEGQFFVDLNIQLYERDGVFDAYL